MSQVNSNSFVRVWIKVVCCLWHFSLRNALYSESNSTLKEKVRTISFKRKGLSRKLLRKISTTRQFALDIWEGQSTSNHLLSFLTYLLQFRLWLIAKKCRERKFGTDCEKCLGNEEIETQTIPWLRQHTYSIATGHGQFTSQNWLHFSPGTNAIVLSNQFLLIFYVLHNMSVLDRLV